jgi:hypothetical protein
MSGVVKVHVPITTSPHQCRTQIVVNAPAKLVKKFRKGKVLGNHFLFVPGDWKDEMKYLVRYFRVW